MPKITKEHVEQAVAKLKDLGFMSDTGPGEDGKRNKEQWENALREDAALSQLYLTQVDNPLYADAKLSFALAAKEARRYLSDIYRYAEEVYDISKEDIDWIPT